MARILLLILLLLPLARPALPETPVDVRLQYIERDLDRLRQEIGTRPEMARLQRLEAEIAGVRAALKETEKAATDSVKEKLDAQDKRIGDLSVTLTQGANTIASSSNAISSASNATSWIVGLLGAALTAGLVGVGLYTALKVPEQARLTARIEARDAIAEHMRSAAGQEQVVEAVKVVNPFSEIRNAVPKSQVQWSDSARSDAPSPNVLPPLDAEHAIEKILDTPSHARTANQWRALILDRIDQKMFEAALAIAEEWLALPMQNRAHTAYALRTKALALTRAGRVEESIRVYDDLIKRFNDDVNLDVLEHVAVALNSKGIALCHLNPPKYKESCDVFNELIERFNATFNIAIRKEVAGAMINIGVSLGKLNPPQHENEISIYNEAIQKFSTDSAFNEHVAIALLNKGIAFSKINPPQHEKSIITFNDLINRFTADSNIKNIIAQAFIEKGNTLCKIHPMEENGQIASYNEVINRFDKDPTLRDFVARALMNKIIVLENLNLPIELQAAYEDYLNRFNEAPEQDIVRYVPYIRARLNTPNPARTHPIPDRA